MVSGYKDKIPMDSEKTPTWIRRKAKGIEETTLNFHFLETLDLLNFCTRDSLVENYQSLVDYFVDAYDMKADIAEAWVTYTITDDRNVISKHYEMDPLLFRVDDKKIAFPATDQKQAYEDYFANYDNNRNYVNLRIGSTNTKEDVIWLIEHYWDDVKQVLQVNEPRIQKRKDRGALLRDSMIYVMSTQRKKKPTANEVQTNLDTFFPNANNVDITTISKIRKKFEPKDDWFTQPRKRVELLTKVQKFEAYKLKLHTDPKPHFMFE